MNHDKEIEFQNIGRRKQHKNELVKMIQRCVDMEKILSHNPESSQTYTDEIIDNYWNTVTEYLQNNGIEDPRGLWCCINGDLVRIPDGEVVGRDEATGSPLPAMPLWAAIQERDKSRSGQTGDYLAALVYLHCQSFTSARNQVLWNWERATQAQTKMYVNAMSDSAMLAQTFFFQLYLLEVIHPQYSAGKTRTNEANDERNKKPYFEAEAESMFRELREQQPKPSKEQCYRTVANQLKKKYRDKEPPLKGTIKDWFKSRTDLP